MTDSLAVYTTVYPAALRFLDACCEGLARQTDRSFALCVGLDGVTPDDAGALARLDVPITWTTAAPGESPGALRVRALDAAARRHDAVVLVDADDVAHPERIARARAGLGSADVVACAMDLVDEAGAAIGERFTLPEGVPPARVLPHANAFGFGNSAYRSNVLSDCLVGSDGVVAMDWLVASRAALLGASFAFDRVSRVDYRQHGASTTRLLPPFDGALIRRDADRVATHYRSVLASESAGRAERAPFERAAQAALPMLERLRDDGAAADALARDLARRPRRLYLWWEHLAPEGWSTP